MIGTIAMLIGATLAGNNATRSCRDVPAPPPAGDYMYTFTTKDESGSETNGTVRVHGDRTRIDMDRNDSHDYIILTDGGKRMLSVHPDRKEVSQISSPNFERIIGTSLKAVSPLVKFKVRNTRISFGRVATGQKLLGYGTEQIRITEQFDVHIVAMGFDGGTEHHTVVTDYWVSPGLDLGNNPIMALLEHAATAEAQTDADFVEEETRVRAQALQGTPLRTEMKESTANEKGIQHTNTRSMAITSVKLGPQPAALFEIPSGYRYTTNTNISM